MGKISSPVSESQSTVVGSRAVQAPGKREGPGDLRLDGIDEFAARGRP